MNIIIVKSIDDSGQNIKFTTELNGHIGIGAEVMIIDIEEIDAIHINHQLESEVVNGLKDGEFEIDVEIAEQSLIEINRINSYAELLINKAMANKQEDKARKLALKLKGMIA